MESIVPVIIILVFVFAGLIKRVLERVAEQAEGRPDAPPGFEAPPEEVREFLESLQGAQGPAPQVRAGAPDAGLAAVPPALQERDLLLGPTGEDVLQRPFTVPAAEPRPAPRPAPGAEPRARRRRRPTEGEPARRLVTKPARAAPPQQVVEAGLVPPLALGRFGLRRAVVWSEILGQPVSLRGPRVGPPVRRRGL